MRYKILLLIAAITAGAASCYRDVISPGVNPNGPPQDISFSGDLVPLFQQSCAGTGCHDAVPSHAPSLVADKAYNALTTQGFINMAVPEKSIIYVDVSNGSMPPTGGLSAAESKKILDWIRNGAPNN